MFFRIAIAIPCVSAPAAAHQMGISRGEYRVTSTGIDVMLTFAAGDLEGIERAQTPTDAGIAAVIFSALTIRASGLASGSEGLCRSELGPVLPTEQDGATIEGHFACPTPIENIEIFAGFTSFFAPRHRHILHILGPSGTQTDVATSAHPTVTAHVSPPLAKSVSSRPQAASGPPPPVSPDPLQTPDTADVSQTGAGRSYFTMGFEHILEGIDHLLFLLALTLVPRPFGALLGAMTAFTLGHAVSLALTSLTPFTPSPRWIEPLIALSISLIAIENLRSATAAGRWKGTLFFGLLHGFGFAAALRTVGFDAGLPSTLRGAGGGSGGGSGGPSSRHGWNSRLEAIALFNVGVEAGQLLVVAGALVLTLALVRHASWRAQIMRWGSCTLAVIGFAWFLVRLGG